MNQQHQMNYGGYYPTYPGYYGGYPPQNYGQQQLFMAHNAKGAYVNKPVSSATTLSSTNNAPGLNPAQTKNLIPQNHSGFQGYGSQGFNNNEDPRLSHEPKNSAQQNFSQGQNGNRSSNHQSAQGNQQTSTAAQRPTQRPAGSFDKYTAPSASANAPNHEQMNYAQMNGYHMNQQQYGFNPMMHQGYQHQGQFYAGGQQGHHPQHPRSQQQHAGGTNNSVQQQSHEGQNWANEN